MIRRLPVGGRGGAGAWEDDDDDDDVTAVDDDGTSGVLVGVSLVALGVWVVVVMGTVVSSSLSWCTTTRVVGGPQFC